MSTQKKLIAIILTMFIFLIIVQCNTGVTLKNGINDSTHTIIPIGLPIIPNGFNFPEDSNTIYKWINNPYDSTSVYKHAWGIWAGLTAQSGQVFEGDSLLVYQTWLGIDEIQNLVRNGVTDKKDFLKKNNRTILRVPNQLLHTGLIDTNKIKVQDIGGFHLNVLNFKAANKNTALADTTFGLTVAVSYDPAAVDHVVSNSLLKASVLASYAKNNAIGSIPAFPNNAMTIKPDYFVGHTADTLIRILVWQGVSPSKVFPNSVTDSNKYVFADVLNRQPPGKTLKPVKGGQQAADSSTCNLSDFINFKIDTTMAAYLNQQQGAGNFSTNDVAILMAMHVTTKEISNWTWQSYYWDPNPNSPLSPSSQIAASLKQPVGIKGAAAHYSVTTAYAMVLPNQPITGGTTNKTTPMIGFNPYLEALFGPTTFLKRPNKQFGFQYGVQTNCMTCHSLATADGKLGYSTDQYIDMRDTIFT